MLKRPVRKWSLVAAVVLVLVAVATGLILRSTPFGTSTRALCAEFTDTSGLYEGNVVAMLGKKSWPSRCRPRDASERTRRHGG